MRPGSSCPAEFDSRIEHGVRDRGMGTWGPNAFEDDIACDWLEDLIESDPAVFLRECLDLSDQAEPSHVASVGAICTAEMVHAGTVGPRAGFPAPARDWLESHPEVCFQALVPPAIAAVMRVLHRSEMREQWEDEPDIFPLWSNSLQDLLRSLLTQLQ